MLTPTSNLHPHTHTHTHTYTHSLTNFAAPSHTFSTGELESSPVGNKQTWLGTPEQQKQQRKPQHSWTTEDAWRIVAYMHTCSQSASSIPHSWCLGWMHSDTLDQRHHSHKCATLRSGWGGAEMATFSRQIGSYRLLLTLLKNGFEQWSDANRLNSDRLKCGLLMSSLS